MASFFDTTFVTSTVGAVGAEAWALVVEPEFEPHETHQPIAAPRSKVNEIRNRVMPFLRAKRLHFARTRSQGHRGRAKATGLPRPSEPAKTPTVESTEWQRWQRVSLR